MTTPEADELRALGAKLKSMEPCAASQIESQPCCVRDVRFVGRELTRMASRPVVDDASAELADLRTEIVRLQSCVENAEAEQWDASERAMNLKVERDDLRARLARAEALLRDERRMAAAYPAELAALDAACAMMRESAELVLMKYGTGLGAYGDLARVLATTNAGVPFIERLASAEAEVSRLRTFIRATTSSHHAVCPECGPHVRIDEERCCGVCGADTTPAICDCAGGAP